MKMRLIAFFLVFCIVAGSVPAYATTDSGAQKLNDLVTAFGVGYEDFRFLFDDDLTTTQVSYGKASITIMSEKPMGYLYLIFDKSYGSYLVENATNGNQATVGGYGCLHECLNLVELFGETTTSVTLRFEQGRVSLNEMVVYSEGELPKDVQQWKPPAEGKTDILLLSTHADDDQLFFAGLLPLYAGEKGSTVQVAYLTDHRNLQSDRIHEALNGLWAVGCDVYPVFAPFPDFRIDDLQESYAEFERLGVSKKDLMEYVIGLLRRFRPQVVVGHDINGEYGHGMHMVYTDCLIQSLYLCGDESSFPKLAEQYGVWEVPKTYLHLYEENPIVIDYDKPLASFDDLTAFEVSQQLGYPCHESQQYTWFTDWIYGEKNEITKASQIKTYNPGEFGLYHSTVGEDVEKDDFLENITTYAEQDRIQQIQQQQQQQQQEEAEQAKREQELAELEAKEQQRLEQLRQEQEKAKQEQLAQQQQQAENPDNAIPWFLPPLLLLGCIGIILILIAYFRRKHR